VVYGEKWYVGHVMGWDDFFDILPTVKKKAWLRKRKRTRRRAANDDEMIFGRRRL
jgi:hypothetical protein